MVRDTMAKRSRFSKFIALLGTPFHVMADGRDSLGRRHEAVRVREPEVLANYLVRDFAATLFVIPEAIQGLAPKNAATLLRQTRDILADLGYEKRCRLLLLFASLIENPSIQSLGLLCSFIDAPAQDDLRRSLDKEGAGDGYYALAVLGCFSRLIKKVERASTNRTRPVLEDFQGKPIKISSPERMQIHEEWKTVRQILKKLDTHSSSRANDPRRVNWQRQCIDQLKNLRYLSFLSPAIMELSDKLLFLAR